MRYTYSLHDSRQSAEYALEDMFASGTVSEGEFPEIERCNETAQHGRRFKITLGDTAR